MLVVGLASLAATAGLLAHYVIEGLCRPADCGPDRGDLIAGAITLGVGVGLTVAGTRVWRRRGNAQISDMPAAASTATRWRLTPAAGLRWTGLALTGSF
jgi:hypothetical protein